MNRRFLLTLGVLMAGSAAASADQWPGWRGPTGDGLVPAGAWPVEWSADRNMAWKLALDGKGASTPVVWDDRVFLTLGQNGKNTLLCVSLKTGQRQWSVELNSERAGKHAKATGSNPSAVTDGRHVFVYFKSGDLACVDFEGRVKWQHNLQQKFGEDTLWWDLGTSPVLTRQHVVVACMHSGPSWLAAFDKASGELAWKADRNLDAPDEAAQSYSTPVVATLDGQELLYTLGADHVTAHDAASGKEMWRVGGFNPGGERFFRSIASPAAADGVLVAPYARGKTVTAITLGGSGDVTKSHVAWRQEGVGADVPTPVIRDGKVYLLTDRGLVVVLSLNDGRELARMELEKNRNAYSASPVLAGNHLYLTREDGRTSVVDVTSMKVVGTSDVGEMTVATPVFVDGKILLRTSGHLYCVSR